MFRFVLGIVLGMGAVYVINEHPELAAQAAASVKAQLDRQLERWVQRHAGGSQSAEATLDDGEPAADKAASYRERLSGLSWQQLWQRLESGQYAERAAAAEIILERSKLAAQPATVRQIERHYLRSADPQVRRAGFSYLGVLGLLDVAPGRIESLCRSYVERHGNDEASDAALWALGQLGRTSLAHYFISIAADPTRYGPQVRRRALCCLARCGRYSRQQRRSFVPLLEQLYRSSPDEQTRQWVAKAIRDCSG